MNLQLIKRYSEHYPGGLRKLAADAGMSESTMHRCIRINKIQANDLEAISRLLSVGVEVFFTETQNTVKTHANNPQNHSAWLHEKIEILEQRINDKDELIKLLKAQYETRPKPPQNG